MQMADEKKKMKWNEIYKIQNTCIKIKTKFMQLCEFHMEIYNCWFMWPSKLAWLLLHAI